ncbi:hypothetical protein [Gynuella sp.]|uniref:hypothetical protein n=1 Tax=Gynuella sp. TaxID=2969146 RepID=UPI003D0A700A
MNLSIFNSLDSFLSVNDHESMDWCDGGEYEVAEGYLADFNENDWLQLRACWREKTAQWQSCLVSILYPAYGRIAQDIILEMAQSKNPELAFEAMYCISFYCGINTNSGGEFIDEKVVNSEFKEYLKKHGDFLASINSIGKAVGRKYELLQQVLGGQP